MKINDICIKIVNNHQRIITTKKKSQIKKKFKFKINEYYTIIKILWLHL